MDSVEYVLRPKSLHSTRPPAPNPEYRLLGFDLIVERVSLRNEFAAVPDVAIGVLRAVADELEAITSRATESEGSEAYAVTQELFETELRATAPDHWR